MAFLQRSKKKASDRPGKVNVGDKVKKRKLVTRNYVDDDGFMGSIESFIKRLLLLCISYNIKLKYFDVRYISLRYYIFFLF